jgi:hypothetical protein
MTHPEVFAYLGRAAAAHESAHFQTEIDFPAVRYAPGHCTSGLIPAGESTVTCRQNMAQCQLQAVELRLVCLVRILLVGAQMRLVNSELPASQRGVLRLFH